MIDSHAHLDLLDRLDSKISNAKSAGITTINTIASNFSSNEKILAISKKYRNYVFPVVGLDPTFSVKETEKIKNVPFEKGIAIGEIGLDYYWFKEKSQQETQKKLFELQLQKAEDLKKPVVIHSRESMVDCLAILKKYKTTTIIHCFSEGEKELDECLKRGYWISFATNACYAEKLQKLINKCPLDRILTETDSPYLHPLRKGRNEPANICELVKLISKIKNIDFEKVNTQTEKNARSAFQL